MQFMNKDLIGSLRMHFPQFCYGEWFHWIKKNTVKVVAGIFTILLLSVSVTACGNEQKSDGCLLQNSNVESCKMIL